MSQLTIKNNSTIEWKLYDAWRNAGVSSWEIFIKSLDKNIIRVRYDTPYTNVWFKDDAHTTWFILRWS
jgi:hypothetical protein